MVGYSVVEQERSAEDGVLLGQEGAEVREEPGEGLLPVEEEEEVGQHRGSPLRKSLPWKPRLENSRSAQGWDPRVSAFH